MKKLIKKPKISALNLINEGNKLNPNKTEAISTQNTYQTPWRKRLLNRQEQLTLKRDLNGVVTVKVLSKDDSKGIFSQIGKLFGKKAEEKLTVEFEKTFTNISIERFENEKKELQKLFDEHTSINALLKQVEKDLQDPTLLPEEIAERHTNLKKIRAKLEVLIAKIDEEESSPELRAYEELRNSIERIKKASKDAFLKISDFQKQITNPAVTASHLEELAKEIAQLEANNASWNHDFETLIKTLSIEKDSLQMEFDKVNQQIQLLPNELKKSWEELNARWSKVVNLTSMNQAQQFSSEIATTIAQIIDKYQTGVKSKINDSLLELKKNLDATAPNFLNADKQQSHLDFRNNVFNFRKNVWMSIQELCDSSDFKTFETMQQRMLQEQAVDQVLVATLEITTDEESYLDKFISFIAPVTSLISPYIPEIPAYLNPFHKYALLTEKETFDNTALFYLNLTLHKMNETIISFQELLPYEETDQMIEQYHQLVNSESVLESDFNAFINDVIAFAQAALNSDDSLDKYSIQAAIAEVQGQREALSIIIKTQRQHVETIIKKAKSECSKLFDQQKIRPSIYEAASAAIQEIFPEEVTDHDLKSLSLDWQNSRSNLSIQLDTLKYLNTLEYLQKEYIEVAKKREKEIALLTGEEKMKGEDLLQDLRETINSIDESLNEYFPDASTTAAYKTKLEKVNSAFIPVFEVENKKKEMRSILSKEIESFSSYLDHCVNSVEGVEKHFDIKLKDAKEIIKNKRDAIKEWNEQGQLPNEYLKYLPNSLLTNLLYYATPNLSFEDVKVIDLNVNELTFYIENLKAVINNHKSELSSHRISETFLELKNFQEETKKLEQHTKTLTASIKARTTFSGTTQYQIPPGLSVSDLPRLQFHNATLTEERQKNLLEQQKKEISSKPDLKFIYQKLKNDTAEATNLLKQSQRGQILSLLDQIQKLENHPEKLNLAKRAFIETITSKMNEHTKSMTDVSKKFKSYPKINEEAVRQLERTEKELFKRLETAPIPLQSHADGWSAIEEANTLSFSTKDDLDIQSLSYTDLKNYLENIDKTIKQGNDYIKSVKNVYDSVKNATQKFQDKINEAKLMLRSLDRNNQILEMQRLNNIMARAEKMNENYMAVSEQPEEGYFPSFNFFITPSKNVNPQHAALRLLEGYKKNIGESISKIEAALRKIKQGKNLTLPQQLALSTDSKTTEDIRARFQREIQPKIDSARKQLEKYKNGKYSIAYTRYVSSSRLIGEIEQAINDKMYELERFEKGYKASSGLTGLFEYVNGSTPLSEFDSKQMEDYYRQLSKLETMLKDDLEKKFQIESLIKAKVNYVNMLDKTVPEQLEKLRKKELFSEAFLLERRIDEITQKEAKWVEKVQYPGQIKDLINDLKKFTREISHAIDEFSHKAKPRSYEDQIIMLLKRKEEYSNPIFKYLESDNKNQEIRDQINVDLNNLKTKLAAKIDQGYNQHQNDLIKLKHDIEEIYSLYNIKLQPKESLLNLIDNEISKFEFEGSKFETPRYQFLSNLTGSESNSIVNYFMNTKKHIEEMEPEEIAKLRPEKSYQEVIDGSFNKISSCFNYKQILEPHKAYTEALEEAEKRHAKLIQKEQIIYAHDLDRKMKSIKNDHEKLLENAIQNDQDLNQLSKKLRDFSAKLKIAQSHAKNLPEMDIADQINQIDSISPSSPYRESLRKSIVKNIQDSIEKRKEYTDKTQQYLNNLVNQIGFPYEWRESIIKEQEKCMDDLETNHANLVSSISKNTKRPTNYTERLFDHFADSVPLSEDWKNPVKDTIKEKIDTFGQAFKNKAENFDQNHPYVTMLPKILKNTFQKGYNVGFDLFIGSGLDLPLSDFDINDLVYIHKIVKFDDSHIKEFDSKYGLKKLNKQLEAYEKQIKTMEFLKAEWTNNHYFDSVKELDNLLSQCQKVFEEFFAMSKEDDLQSSMQNLLPFLKDVTSNLYYKTTNIKQTKPKSLGELLSKVEFNSPEYITLCKAIYKKLKENISEHKKFINSYFKKVDSINQQIQSKLPLCPVLPIKWSQSVEEKINKYKEALERLSLELNSQADLTYPFEGFTPETILKYETYVNQLVAKEDNPNGNKNSIFARLEKMIKLKELEEYFSNYHKAIKTLESAISKPNNPPDKKETLETILAATNKVVYNSINQMQYSNDSSFLSEVLEQAHAIFLRASQEGGIIHTNNIDPWSRLYTYEESKGVGPFPSEAVDLITTNGFAIGYNRNLECNVISLEKKITNAKNHLEKSRALYEDKASYLLQMKLEKDPDFEILDQFLKKYIPELNKEIVSLITETNLQKLNNQDNKIFKNLLSLKNRIERCIGNFYEELQKISELPILAQSAKDSDSTSVGFVDINQVPVNNEENFDVDQNEDLDGYDFGDLSDSEKSDIIIDDTSPFTPKSTDSKEPIQTDSTKKHTNYTLEANLLTLKSLTQSLEQMILHEPSIESCYPEDLVDLKKKHHNEKFMQAYRNFISIWNLCFQINMIDEAGEIGEQYLEEINKIIPWKEKDAPFKTSLLDAYKKIMPYENLKNWTISEWILHLKICIQAPKIKNQLIKIANYCHQIYAIHFDADNQLESGESEFLSFTMVENWLKELERNSKNLNLENLDYVECCLDKLLNTCQNALKEDLLLKQTKAELDKKFEVFFNNFTKKIKLIEKTCGIHFNYDNIINTFGDINHEWFDVKKKLKLNTLSQSELQKLKVNMLKAFNAVDYSGLKEAYVALKKYNKLSPETNKKIENLQTTKQYQNSQKLNSILNSANNLFNTFKDASELSLSDKINFKDFASKLEDIILKLEKNLKNPEKNDVDFISQVQECSDKDTFNIIRNTIIEEKLMPIINKIKSKINLIPKEILKLASNKIDEINFKIENLISSAKQFDVSKKNDFTLHIDTCEATLKEFSITIESIQSMVNLPDDKKILEFFKKADLASKELEPKQYFYLKKLSKLTEEMNVYYKAFKSSCQENKPLEKMIFQSKNLSNAIQSLESCLQEIMLKKRMNPFEQLKAAENEPDILNDQEKKFLVEKVKKHGITKIKETIEIINQLNSLINLNSTNKAKESKLDYLNILMLAIDSCSSHELEKNVLASIKEHQKFSGYLKDLKAFELFLNEAKNKKDLKETVEKVGAANQKLLKKFTSFEAYFKGLKAQSDILATALGKL